MTNHEVWLVILIKNKRNQCKISPSKNLENIIILNYVYNFYI